MKDEFLAKTKMIDVNGDKNGVIEVAEYLFDPRTIYKMIIASDMELPVLTLVAKELESKFGANSTFPLVVTDKNKNAVYRQNVGRIIKYILAEYGYIPVDGGLSERARIPAVSGAEYFATSAIYEKRLIPKLDIEVKSINI